MASWVVYPSQLSQPPDFTDASNTSTRRHHSKSRTGCTVCKKRRIKCDETKPACRQCVDYGRQCSFLITGLQAVAGEPQQQHAHGRDASKDELFEQIWEKLQPQAELCTLGELSIQKACLQTLLSHFIGCEDEWLAAPTFQQILQQHGVQLGLRSDYLLHAILAVTASHLHYLDPTKAELELIYGFHNSCSLRLYREKLNNIQPEDADALFACGAIHTILAIRHTLLDAIASRDMLDGFDGLLLGLKSVKSFPAFHCPLHEENRMTNGQFHRFLPTCEFAGQWTTEVNQEVSERTSHLAGLEIHLRQLAGSAAFEDTYREPFQCLILVGDRQRRSNALDMIFSFSNQLKTRYFEELEEQAPVALLLLGYWLAMFSTIKQWWITKPAVTLCERFYVHLLGVLPSTVQGREALLAPVAQAMGWGAKE
jgi:Fungal Zn(2)-Cys(6) binuclear cluster domain